MGSEKADESMSNPRLKKTSTPVAPQFQLMDLHDLKPSPRNPRKHSRQQIRAIAASIQEFGFAAPVLIGKDNEIIAGHARTEAAKFLKLTQIPVVRLSHLTDAQVTAYRLADNQLGARSTFDDKMVALQLKELSELAIEFNMEAIGFELPDLDFRIASLDDANTTDRADEFAPTSGSPVSTLGDVWLLDDHRLLCGDALDETAYITLMGGNKASASFIDAPYNVRVNGHVGGRGRIRHREFAMGSGEMSKPQFTDFLTIGLKAICAHTIPGAVVFSCIDWRSIVEMDTAGKAANCDLLNLCIWSKSNAGLGSIYRSQHELIFVFRTSGAPHRNNIELGRHGRNRSNIWNYPSANAFARKGAENLLALHPTSKPIAMVADAIMDVTARGDIVLDNFVGAGTTILAAEKIGRRGYGIEIDPQYCGTAIERWQRFTGRQAVNLRGETYDDLKAAAGAAHD
jgi:hypothetical protein